MAVPDCSPSHPSGRIHAICLCPMLTPGAACRACFVRPAPCPHARGTCVLPPQGTAYPPAWRNNLRREVRQRVRAQFGGKRPLLLKVGACTAGVAHGQR